MPMPTEGLTDEMKMQLLRESEEKSKARQGIQPGRPRPTKYTAPGITKEQLQALAPFYVDLGPKPPIFNPKRIKWYYTKHKERKKLRKQLKEEFGITKRSEFETIAREVGLGIDNPIIAWLWWFLSWLLGAGGVASVLGASALLLGTFFVYSYITEQVGSFTIQLNPGTMESKFSLSDEETFDSETARLISEKMNKVNAISIKDLDELVDTDYDGSHNGEHNVAYTFYIKNTSDKVQSYEYVLKMTDSVADTEKAIWVMLYEDGKQVIYASPKDDGTPACLYGLDYPKFKDDAYDVESQYYFYLGDPDFETPDIGKSEDEMTEAEKFNKKNHILLDQDGNRVKFAEDANGNYKITEGNLTDAQKTAYLEKASGKRCTKYWGIKSTPSLSKNEVMRGIVEDIEPGEIHKYTVVIWLEGDDPDCTDDLFDGYAKYMIEFYPTSEENKSLFSNVYRREYDINP